MHHTNLHLQVLLMQNEGSRVPFFRPFFSENFPRRTHIKTQYDTTVGKCKRPVHRRSLLVVFFFSFNGWSSLWIRTDGITGIDRSLLTEDTACMESHDGWRLCICFRHTEGSEVETCDWLDKQRSKNQLWPRQLSFSASGDYQFCFQICVWFSILVRQSATVNERLKISGSPTSESYIRLFWVVGTKTVTNVQVSTSWMSYECVYKKPLPLTSWGEKKSATRQGHGLFCFFLLWKHRSPFKPLQRLGWCSHSTQSLKKRVARNMCRSEAEHTWTLLCEVMSNIWDLFFF